MNRIALISTMIVGFMPIIEAQTPSRQTVTQFTDWFSTSANMKFSSRINLFVDGQYRFVNGAVPAQMQIRLGGDYKINDAWLVMPVAYVYVWNYKYGDQPVAVVNNEHRVFQQVAFKHRSGNFRFQHRFRTEERFIERHKVEPGGALVSRGFTNQQFRIRYRVLFNLPLTHQVDPTVTAFDPKTLYIQVYDEIFMSWGEVVTYDEPDQNRVFVGLGCQFTKDFTIQSGFFYQLLVKANGLQQENNMGLGVWLAYNIDFTK